MYKKPFVSVVFSQEYFDVFLLSPKHDSVVASKRFATPQGYIVQNKVSDVKKFAELLRTAWKELKLSEKNVGIVVPEFSTFSKTVELPLTLSMAELPEAVSWSCQEFIPQGAATVIDWKIVSESTTHYKILVFSMLEEILQSYVSACDEAGLLPLIVETPSLALLRFAEKDVGVKLFIHKDDRETLLVLVQDGAVLTSTTVSSVDPLDIARIANQIFVHFAVDSTDSVLVTGIWDDSFAKVLTEQVKRPVGTISLSTFGYKGSDLQRFLLGFSLQLRVPQEPHDPYSINLLPPSWVRRYDAKRLRFQLWSLSLIFSTVVWACFFIAVIVFSMIAGQLITAKHAIDEAKKVQPSTELSAQISSVNLLANKVISIESTIRPYQTILNLITKYRSADIFISSYHIDMETGKVFLTGIANNRPALVAFKNSLEADDSISLVRIPLSSFETQTNLAFDMNFLYMPPQQSTLSIPIPPKN
jgi:hypothetical protein